MTNESRVERYAPRWLLTAAVRCAAVLIVAATVWLVGLVVLAVPLIAGTAGVSLLLTALISPVASRLRRARVPSALAAVISIVVLVGVPGGIVLLMWTQIAGQIDELTASVTEAIGRIREYLVTGPLSLDPKQVDEIHNQVVGYINSAVPEPAAAARMVVYAATALVLALFTVFFLLKDGDGMWRWLLARTPERRRDRIDGAGRHAWKTLTRYMGGTTLVALTDAVLIGAGLVVMGVPQWLPLTLLIFLGAYVPVLGATVSGAAAVLVTLVTVGFTQAVIILVVVLVVQQIEGNLLQPFLMGHAVYLHPVVILFAVTTGALVLGIPGALFAVPIVAVSYRTAEYLRSYPK